MAKQTKGFLWGTIAGGIVGSVAALLLAPKSGKELRGDISEGAQKVGSMTLNAVNQVGETTSRVAKQIGGQAADFAGKAKQAGIGLADTVKSWRTGGAEPEELAEVSSHEARAKELEETFDGDKENDDTLRF
ncbi:YtxH domain-containing protein [Paenibacillus thailandensis]|uniref:YtxH domain-containing protein n=1 Tax=Paenibacillus thailandensis TaxID=393250 RepID=A0ABW5QZF8_9BACL